MITAIDMTEFLVAAQSSDGGVRRGAETSLRQFQEHDLPQFLLSLSFELANDYKPVESRRLAGILVKNSLDVRKDNLVEQWVAIDTVIRSHIKTLLLTTLGSYALEARQASAQVIAKLASVEIPLNQWPELVKSLLSNMTHQASPAHLKQSTLETLGYVCEEISHEHLTQGEVDSVLTALVRGMDQSETSAGVRLAATKALLNALDFARANFEIEKERDHIMKAVCNTAVSQEAEIKQAAFECLVSIASTYYELLEHYMLTLFTLTSNAITGDEESVALQAIEFWSSICDEETEIQGLDNPNPSHSGFIKQAFPHLVPILLETLLKQGEDQDQDDDDYDVWSISMAAGTCLGLVARTVGDDIVPFVTPFITAKINAPQWRIRDAATYAFGSILEGPTVVKLAPLVCEGLEFLLNATKDDIKHVRHTTAWTLSRIFEFLHCPASGFSVISTENLHKILVVLQEAMNDAPDVAEKICGAIYNIAQGYEDVGSSLLSPYLTMIIQTLLAAAERRDGGGEEESKLRAVAYETLNAVVRCSDLAKDSNIVAQLLTHIMEKIADTIHIPNREKQADRQASLCGVLQVIIQKLSATDNAKPILMQKADEIMSVFLSVFACHHSWSSVHEEAMLAIGSFAYATGPEFAKYVPKIFKYLKAGLENFKEHQVCSITVGVIGDICRALDDKILPCCDEIMDQLLQNLQSHALHRCVKPPIISCFGDIALAIGAHFERYLTQALLMIQGAAHICVEMDKSDEELMDLANQLLKSIFEAYSGILQGFKDDAKAEELMMPHAHYLLQLIEFVSKDGQWDESVMKAAVAAMGDLADVLGQNTKQLFNNFTFCGEFLSECLHSQDPQLKETAIWTHAMIGQL